jgi:hypothetical protein
MSAQGPNPSDRIEASAPGTPTILTIGRFGPESDAHIRKRKPSVIATGFPVLDATLLGRVAPDAIAFSLIDPEADAIQVIERLVQLGFRGEAIIFAPRLPDRQMILRELRGLAKGMTVTLVEPGEA